MDTMDTMVQSCVQPLYTKIVGLPSEGSPKEHSDPALR